VRKSSSSIERWAVPGCNFFGDTEISVGANFQSDTNLPASQYHLIQAKKRWRVLEPGEHYEISHTSKAIAAMLDITPKIPNTARG
jgi:hypothetical protein